LLLKETYNSHYIFPGNGLAIPDHADGPRRSCRDAGRKALGPATASEAKEAFMQPSITNLGKMDSKLTRLHEKSAAGSDPGRLAGIPGLGA
jgi:hypothetical protein